VGHIILRYTTSISITLKIVPKRYRFIIQVILAEKGGQDLVIGSRWLWNKEHDNHCSVIFETGTGMSVNVIFHTLYQE